MLDASGFTLDRQGRVVACPVMTDPAAHGSVMAAIILAQAPEVRLLNAQVFYGTEPVAPAAVAAALDWLAQAGARVINLSFGLREDRPVLRAACEQAVAHGVLLVAAMPVRGEPVFPPAIPAYCGSAETPAARRGNCRCCRTAPPIWAPVRILRKPWRVG